MNKRFAFLSNVPNGLQPRSLIRKHNTSKGTPEQEPTHEQGFVPCKRQSQQCCFPAITRIPWIVPGCQSEDALIVGAYDFDPSILTGLLSLLAGCSLLLRALPENGWEGQGVRLGVPRSCAEVGAGLSVESLGQLFSGRVYCCFWVRGFVAYRRTRNTRLL